MRTVRKILFILAIIILVIAAVGFLFFPSHIHVERSTIINQKQSVVFNYVNNLDNWNSWSPWYRLDTTAKYHFEGVHLGKGAILRWESENKNVGIGKMTITESKPDSLIMQDLNFMDQGTAYSSFRLSTEDNSTKFTWAFDVEAGANPLFRIMGSFMDGMVGKDFEKGLSALKNNLENLPEPDSVVVQ
jgi:Polyketide cyclase / dehydrase and lipid transport